MTTANIAEKIALRYSHASRIVREGPARNAVFAIQTKEPEGRWRRYSGGFGTAQEAHGQLDEYYASGWFPAHMMRVQGVTIVSVDDAARSSQP